MALYFRNYYSPRPTSHLDNLMELYGQWYQERQPGQPSPLPWFYYDLSDEMDRRGLLPAVEETGPWGGLCAHQRPIYTCTHCSIDQPPRWRED